jgi:TIR domain
MTSTNRSYVPSYEHDIFISYAHIDNEPLFGAQEGWVTTLVNNLKNLLGVKLGCVEVGKAEAVKKEVYSLWMDYKLRGNEPVTPDIDKCLKNSATFLPILSTSYLASQWCRLEFETFLNQVGSGSGRIFMVEYHFMERSEKPLEFQELLGYSFWFREPTGRTRTLGIPIPNPNREPEYYHILDDLAHQLASKLRELRIRAERQENTSSVAIDSSDKELVIIRLEAEKTILATEIEDLKQHYTSKIEQLAKTRDPANKAILNNDLSDIGKKVAQIKAKITDLETQLKQLSE